MGHYLVSKALQTLFTVARPCICVSLARTATSGRTHFPLFHFRSVCIRQYLTRNCFEFSSTVGFYTIFPVAASSSVERPKLWQAFPTFSASFSRVQRPTKRWLWLSIRNCLQVFVLAPIYLRFMAVVPTERK